VVAVVVDGGVGAYGGGGGLSSTFQVRGQAHSAVQICQFPP
jgi:hypothetical protein